MITLEENPKLFSSTLGNSALARRIQETRLQTFDLHNIASVYATLGDQTRALDFYRQALVLLSTSQNGHIRAAAIRAMANILRQQGHDVNGGAIAANSGRATSGRITVGEAFRYPSTCPGRTPYDSPDFTANPDGATEMTLSEDAITVPVAA